MKREIGGPIHIVATDEDLKFGDISLSEELGYWDNSSNTIYLYTKGIRFLGKAGITAHEITEMLLEKLGLPHKVSHLLANIIEIIVSLGNPVEQTWKV